MVFGWCALYSHFLFCLTSAPLLQDYSYFDERNRLRCTREQVDQRPLLRCGRSLVLHHQRIRGRESTVALRARSFLAIFMTTDTLTSSY